MLRRRVPVTAVTFMCLLAAGTQTPAQPSAQTQTARDGAAAPDVAEAPPLPAQTPPEAESAQPAETSKAAANRAADAGSVHRLVGRISYYGNSFKGRKTACGGHFNPKDLTMAHKTLPCGSLVKVTNLRNNKWVLAHVTDHGPNVAGRVADLSTSAAAQMGLLHHGVTEGQLEVLQFGTPSRGRPAR